jgi:hypothetical protein
VVHRQRRRLPHRHRRVGVGHLVAVKSAETDRGCGGIEEPAVGDEFGSFAKIGCSGPTAGR